MRSERQQVKVGDRGSTQPSPSCISFPVEEWRRLVSLGVVPTAPSGRLPLSMNSMLQVPVVSVHHWVVRQLLGNLDCRDQAQGVKDSVSVKSSCVS